MVVIAAELVLKLSSGGTSRGSPHPCCPRRGWWCGARRRSRRRRPAGTGHPCAARCGGCCMPCENRWRGCSTCSPIQPVGGTARVRAHGHTGRMVVLSGRAPSVLQFCDKHCCCCCCCCCCYHNCYHYNYSYCKDLDGVEALLIICCELSAHANSRACSDEFLVQRSRHLELAWYICMCMCMCKYLYIPCADPNSSRTPARDIYDQGERERKGGGKRGGEGRSGGGGCCRWEGGQSAYQ